MDKDACWLLPSLDFGLWPFGPPAETAPDVEAADDGLEVLGVEWSPMLAELLDRGTDADATELQLLEL